MMMNGMVGLIQSMLCFGLGVTNCVASTFDGQSPKIRTNSYVQKRKI